MCVRERDKPTFIKREREKKATFRDGERGRQRDKERVCVCVCVLERERVIQKREGMRKVEMRDRDTQGEWSNIQQERES